MFQNILDFLMDFGAWGLFIHSFIDAIIFPIPAFFLQVSLSLINPSGALWLATVGFIACLMGTPIGYLIGKLLGNSVLYKILKKEWIDAATKLFKEKGEAAILIGSFTPIPFKVFTIMSGCLNFPLWRLMAYAALGRATKFYVVGALFYFYGRAAEGMVKDVSLYIFLTAVPIILFILFLKKRREKKKQKLMQQESLATDEQKKSPEDQVLQVESDSKAKAFPDNLSSLDHDQKQASEPEGHIEDPEESSPLQESKSTQNHQQKIHSEHETPSENESVQASERDNVENSIKSR